MEKTNNLIVGIQERPSSIGQWVVLSLQHVFAMFGATVLVPLLTGLDVGVALVASGLGTLIYIVSTKGKAPVYLGSSFAYIAAIIASVLNSANALNVTVNGEVHTFSTIWGDADAGVYGVMDAVNDGLFTFKDVYSSAFIGLIIVGLIYVVVALIIKFVGSEWLKKLLPPVVIGPMIIIIGLGLAPVAISSAGLGGGAGWQIPLVAFVTFATVVAISLLGKGFVKIVPFIIAVLVGYLFAAALGLVDFDTFANYRFFQAPNFSIVGTYAVNWSSVLMFAPIAFVTIAEHIGDHTVLGEICEKDFITDPGLDKTLMGDGIATAISGALGGPANTTYGENTGVVAMTKVGSVYVTGLAALFAISLGFFGYIQAFINSIPWAVIGGMTIVLYGLIAGNGVKVLVKSQVNLGNMKNLIIVATMLVIGLGGASLPLNDAVSLTGMSLAALVGIGLNALLNFFESKGLLNQ
nr:solute carrier family 23 protein [Xianfuyuplasma coldseepsis]